MDFVKLFLKKVTIWTQIFRLLKYSVSGSKYVFTRSWVVLIKMYPLRQENEYSPNNDHQITNASFSLTSRQRHYNDVIMGSMASQIISLTVVYSTVYSGADQRKHQSSASLSFVWGVHRWPVNSPHKWPVTRKMFSFHDVIMKTYTVKPVYNDHLYDKIYPLWFIQ